MFKMEEEIKNMIENNPLAVATVNEDGSPHAIAVAFVKIKDDKVIITNNNMEKTIININNKPEVSLVVWDKDLHGYQITGVVEYFEEGEWMEFIKTIEENKDEPCKGALVVNAKVYYETQRNKVSLGPKNCKFLRDSTLLCGVSTLDIQKPQNKPHTLVCGKTQRLFDVKEVKKLN